ncbi:hypothetical protein C7B80_26325 [Cyanosarcina cf. burmensis CCALA 770]|nr:hypothetical protein C7B80_26325 [Cyanosarcina cf. burmensis CCALA 770]
MLGTTSAALDLFVDLNEKDAETVSGGAIEVFTIANRTNARIPYTVDGTRTPNPNPGAVVRWTTGRGGIVAFDYDVRRPGVQTRRYNLSNNSQYAFRPDTKTPYTGDINLYRIG